MSDEFERDPQMSIMEANFLKETALSSAISAFFRPAHARGCNSSNPYWIDRGVSDSNNNEKK